MQGSYTNTFSQSTGSQSQSLNSVAHSATNGFHSSFTVSHSLNSLGAFLAINAIIWLFVLVIYLVASYILGLIFRKTGRKMWPAFVPIYSLWVLFEITDFPAWLSILQLVPIANIVIAILQFVSYYRLAKGFSKSIVFYIFGMLLFPYVGFPMLAFGKSTYSNPKDNNQAQNNPPNPPINNQTNSFNQPNTTNPGSNELPDNQGTSNYVQPAATMPQDTVNNQSSSNLNQDQLDASKDVTNLDMNVPTTPNVINPTDASGQTNRPNEPVNPGLGNKSTTPQDPENNQNIDSSGMNQSPPLS